MATVLLVEDERDLCNLIKGHLEGEGYAVVQAFDGPTALALVEQYIPDLIILDWMLPGMDGLAVCRRVRQSHLMPILMLTARSEEIDRVLGLEVGADDYVVKPFTFEVLSARVKALLRRSEMDHPEVMRFEDLSLDTGTRRAQRGDRTIDLTATEYELLRQFMLHPRRVVEKHILMERVWGFDVEGSSNIVEVYVKQLRQKLEASGEPRLIHTFRGAGYVLREP